MEAVREALNSNQNGSENPKANVNSNLWLKEYRKIHGYDKHFILYGFLTSLAIIAVCFFGAFATYPVSKILFYALFTLGVSGLVAIGFAGNYFVFKPLDEMTDYALRMAGGERDIEVPKFWEKNEVGYISGALSVFHKLSILDYIAASESLELGQERHEKKEAKNQEIVTDFENSVMRVIEGVVSTTSEAIYATTRALTEITETSYKQAELLESESNSSSEKASLVAKSAEELAKGIHEVSNQIDTSTKIVEEALKTSEQASETVNKLEVTANEISDVVQIIDRIANQINLLSLNATIEAVRAGEAGKGFEVVASEVKGLARQVSDATSGIAQRISSIQGVTAETVTAMGQLGEASKRISESTHSIANAMHTQSEITQNITDNIRESFEGIKRVAVISHEVSESSQFTKGVVQEMRSITGDITQQSTMLDMQVKSFLNRIRGVNEAIHTISAGGGEEVELF